MEGWHYDILLYTEVIIIAIGKYDLHILENKAKIYSSVIVPLIIS